MKQDILKNYYSNIIKQKELQAFLISLADYLEYILNDDKGKSVISEIEKVKEDLFGEKEKWEGIVVKQVRAMKKAEGKNENDSSELSDKLAERAIYSRANPKLLKIEKEIGEGQKNSIWGTWDKINFAYFEFKQGLLPKFDVSELIFHVIRFQNYLFEKINESKDEKNSVKKLEFDKNTGLLHIKNFSVKARKFSDQYHILSIIFEDKNELFEEKFFSEISEKLDEAKEHSDKRIYNLVYQLNNKIAKESGVKNFFITTSHSVVINKDYDLS